jgi:hypothetical protein
MYMCTVLLPPGGNPIAVNKYISYLTNEEIACCIWSYVVETFVTIVPDGGYDRTTRVGCHNTLNPELNPICYLLALLAGHHFLHVSRIRVKSLTLRLLMPYIYIYIYIYIYDISSLRVKVLCLKKQFLRILSYSKHEETNLNKSELNIKLSPTSKTTQ